jgi:hypothetical protein
MASAGFNSVESWGSHGEDVDHGLLGCDVVCSCRWFGMKMGAVRSSETLVTAYKTTRGHNPEHHD